MTWPGHHVLVRVFTIAIAAALASAGAALAIEPPQPPIPTETTTTATAPPASGLVGYVSRGPVRPLCRPTESCYRPARVTLQFRPAGRPAVQITTRATGAYRVSLAPGLYTVWVRLVGLQRLKPSVVHVPASGFRRVDFVLGTGIY
jgi:hypothetical protein